MAPRTTAPPGMLPRLRCGTSQRAGSVHTRGLPPTPPDCPFSPGLVRYDEVAAGEIKHAVRFTLQSSRAAFVPPASHWAANSTDPLAAPMGMRIHLKASYDISSFSPTNQVILTALKKYGMIMADNGTSMYIGGAPEDRWSNDDLHNLAEPHSGRF